MSSRSTEEMSASPSSAAGAAPAAVQQAAAPMLDAPSILALAAQAWPGTSPVAVLRRNAVAALLNVPSGPAGPYSLLASVFRQVLSSSDSNAWIACPSFEGSKVKTVMVGAGDVFGAKYVPGETSKAVVLNVEGLMELANDPSKSTEYTPPPGSTPVIPPMPQPPAHQPSSSKADKQGAAAPAGPSAGPFDVPNSQELGLCMMAMALYRPQHAGDNLAILRLKLACLLSRASDSALGPYTILGTHLGDALGRYAPEAWQALPSAGSRLQRLSDSCLLVEQLPSGLGMRLDIHELERAATQATLVEWRSLGAVPGSRKTASGMPDLMAKPASIAPSSGVPHNIGLDITGNLPPVREDDFGLALVAACISMWCPRKWHVAAAVLAMLGQPGTVAVRNGGRHCSHVGFFLKEVQRVAGFNCVPSSDLTTRHISATEPLLVFNTAGTPGGLVSLHLQQLAQAVLDAAKASAEGNPAGSSTGARWPPDVKDLPVSQLHQQAQPLVRQVVHVLSGGEGPEAHAAFLTRCIAQLEQLAGASAAPAAGGGVEAAPGTPSWSSASQTPVVQHQQQQQQVPSQHLVSASTMQAMAQQQQAMKLPQQLQSAQIMAVNAMHPGLHAGMLMGAKQGGPPSMMHVGHMAVQQQMTGPGGMTQLVQVPQNQMPMAAYLPGVPQELQQPLQRLTHLLSVAYPNNYDSASMLRRTAVLHLAITPQGPLGPNSLMLADVCRILRSEDGAAWQAVFGNQPDSQMLRDTINLLHGAPGFVLRPGSAFEVAVQLDVASLERAALTMSNNQANLVITTQMNQGGMPSAQFAAAASMHGQAAQQPVMLSSSPGQGMQVHQNMLQQTMVAGNAPPGTLRSAVMSTTPSMTLNSTAAPFVSSQITASSTPTGVSQQGPAGQQQSQQLFLTRPQVSGGTTTQTGLSSTNSTGSDQQPRSSLTGGSVTSLGGTRPAAAGASAPGSVSGNAKGGPPPAGSSTLHGGNNQMMLGMGMADAPASALGFTTTPGAGDGTNGSPPRPGGLLSTLAAAIQQVSMVNSVTGGLNSGSSQASLDVSPQQLNEWSALAFPGSNAVNVVRRAAIQLLSEARIGPGGPHSMDGPALGLALAKKEPDAYKALPCSTQGKLRLKAVCDNSPVFVRIPTHQTQVCIRLNVIELQRAAEGLSGASISSTSVTPFNSGSDGQLPMSTSASICSKWRMYGTGRPGCGPVPELVQAQQQALCTMADLVYTQWEQLRELKLHAVHLLAGCVSGNGDPANVSGGRGRPLGDYSMMGPEFGNAMSKRVPNLWAAIPGSKLSKLCLGDPYLQACVAGDNRAIRLDVPVLVAAAKSAGFKEGTDAGLFALLAAQADDADAYENSGGQEDEYSGGVNGYITTLPTSLSQDNPRPVPSSKLNPAASHYWPSGMKPPEEQQTTPDGSLTPTPPAAAPGVASSQEGDKAAGATGLVDMSAPPSSQLSFSSQQGHAAVVAALQEEPSGQQQRVGDDASLEGALQHQETALMHLMSE